MSKRRSITLHLPVSPAANTHELARVLNQLNDLTMGSAFRVLAMAACTAALDLATHSRMLANDLDQAAELARQARDVIEALLNDRSVTSSSPGRTRGDATGRDSGETRPLRDNASMPYLDKPKPAKSGKSENAGAVRTRSGSGKFTPLDAPPAAMPKKKPSKAAKQFNEGTRPMTAAEREAAARKQLLKGKKVAEDPPYRT